MLVALDTNVLLDQAIENADVLDAVVTIRTRLPDATFIVPPTVLEELGYQFEMGNAEAQEAAEIALSCMVGWGYKPINVIPVGKGIAERVSFKLRSGGLLPDEEENDGLIIAEAALLGCGLLLSSDRHLVEAGAHPSFHTILKERHVDGEKLIIGSPRVIVSRFFRRK